MASTIVDVNDFLAALLKSADLTVEECPPAVLEFWTEKATLAAAIATRPLSRWLGFADDLLAMAEQGYETWRLVVLEQAEHLFGRPLTHDEEMLVSQVVMLTTDQVNSAISSLLTSHLH